MGQKGKEIIEIDVQDLIDDLTLHMLTNGCRTFNTFYTLKSSRE